VRAYIVADPAVRATDLRVHCAAQLADYKVPETFSFMDQPLPRNANGKVLKRSLRPDAETFR
jgi:non-ribosomal peptide synthetase component E (peptide arylation enzyme)